MIILHFVTRLLASSAVALTAAEHLASQPRLEVENAIFKHLAPLLSTEATIVLPSSPMAGPLLERVASPRISPGYVAIVEVATESDVQQTIKYANQHGMPFLAVSGGHGNPSMLNMVKDGIQINMRRLNHTRLHANGKTANVGGGTLQSELTAALFDHGKQTVTVACECVSVAGPLLGGGHGILQARHGLAADNLVSARVVLADGSAVDVSAKEHPDLFWAVRGTGHNFGILTSLDIKTYDVGARWTLTTLSFTRDRLEALFNTWNELMEKHEDPGMLALLGAMVRNPSLDSRHPVITLQLFHEGDKTAICDYTAAFRKLKPVADSTIDKIPWASIYKAGGYGLDGFVCRKNQNLIGFPNSFARWDVAAMREGFHLFSELTADPTFAGSLFLLETYGNKGLERVLNAPGLVLVANLDIIWTDNLLDHLRLTDDDRRVHIFHHVSFLELQRQRCALLWPPSLLVEAREPTFTLGDSADTLLPPGVGEETLRTLALLFPTADPQTRGWLLRLPSYDGLDARVAQCRRLKTDDRQIDGFPFWRERLTLLKQVFDEAQPQSLVNWWHDRRNGVQWYTFWVAVFVLVLTVFFGLVQSIEGALQTYASFKALQSSPGAGGR
ncbi:FAD-binding, type 2 [Ophiocordyceps sinensis CO18]|uniref:FAD-binding, type 2 n=1 Tax=Ophiocordyceps sinensis (strain Co18 / CGMCC 3.14243) TaxID=911162 RepID=T5AG60_OPHSC|nr:FAD-binding, type 2 [Ophiocordyceps sinensis CO18]